MSSAVETEQCLDSMLDDTLTDVVYQNSSLFNDSLDEEYTVNKVGQFIFNDLQYSCFLSFFYCSIFL